MVDDTRIIAPGHGLDAGLFAEGYVAPSIDEVWSTYTGRGLKVITNAGAFTGRVRGERLSFPGPAEVSFGRPPTADAHAFPAGSRAPARAGVRRTAGRSSVVV